MMTTKPDNSPSMGNKIVKGLKANLLIILMIIAVIVALASGSGCEAFGHRTKPEKSSTSAFPGIC